MNVLRSSLSSPVLFRGSGVPPYRTPASNYDGTNDNALRGGDLTGAADGSAFTFSCWFEPNATGTEMQIIDATNTVFFMRHDTSNRLDFFVKNTIGTIVGRRITTDTYTSGFHHVVVSSSGSNLLMYVDGAVPAFDSSTTPSGETFDLTATEWGIGGRTSALNRWNGCLSEIYYNDEFVDVSDPANLRKFIAPNGQPARMGDSGTYPTGTAPLIYAPDGDPSDNKGTGGNFTITGALTTCANKPGL